jgi:2-methylisocitrate lyase-like PEP mutase family enzyme
MVASVADKRAAFARLHEAGCFTMPNPWDAGSAIYLETLGFKALASTSAGMAWAMGRPDGGVSVDEVLGHLTMLNGATLLPVNADFENGFADDPEGVAANVARAAQTGVAGLSIEDYTGDRDRGLYDFGLAVERIAAARAAIDRTGPGVVLTARSEGFLRGRPDMDETIRRLTAFAEAGADCLYAPGLREDQEIRTVVEALAPRPVNVLTFGVSAERLAGLGVRRISIGSGLASVAWGAFVRSARDIAERGDFEAFAAGVGGRELNPVFAGRL